MSHRDDICVPCHLGPDDPKLLDVLSLLQTTFAYMEGRIDPPSSTHHLSQDDITRQAREAEVWALEDRGRVVACVFLSKQGDKLNLSKLAVATSHRGRGFARHMVSLAQERAKDLGLKAVELQSRVELTDNHSAFAALGFRVAGEVMHPGFDRVTSLTFALPV